MDIRGGLVHDKSRGRVIGFVNTNAQPYSQLKEWEQQVSVEDIATKICQFFYTSLDGKVSFPLGTFGYDGKNHSKFICEKISEILHLIRKIDSLFQLVATSSDGANGNDVVAKILEDLYQSYHIFDYSHMIKRARNLLLRLSLEMTLNGNKEIPLIAKELTVELPKPTVRNSNTVFDCGMWNEATNNFDIDTVSLEEENFSQEQVELIEQMKKKAELREITKDLKKVKFSMETLCAKRGNEKYKEYLNTEMFTPTDIMKWRPVKEIINPKLIELLLCEEDVSCVALGRYLEVWYTFYSIFENTLTIDEDKIQFVFRRLESWKYRKLFFNN